MMDRVLAFAGPDDDDGWRSNLHWFRVFMLLHTAGRTSISVVLAARYELIDLIQLQGVLLTLAAGCFPRFALAATRIAALLVLLQILIPGTAMSLPFTANHIFLEFVVLAFLALLNDRDERESPLLLQLLRITSAVFFFYTGVQKLLYGRYFDGQFLGFLIATDERFAAFFQYLLPAEEFARLQSQGELETGHGPYSVDFLPFLIVSNLTYIFEMVAGALLMVQRIRVWAALAAIVFVVLIEMAARELTFGMMMINLLLLFVPGRWNMRLLPVFVLAYGWLVGAALDMVPMFEYSPA